MIEERADVLIIGAGAAGLAAARFLCAAGMTVRVLEARGRIGGRIFTVHDGSSSLPIELGAEFVHGRAPEVWKIIRTASLPVCDVGGEHRVIQNGLLRTWDELNLPWDQVFGSMDRPGAPDQSFEEFIRSCDCDPAARVWLTAYVEGFNASRRDRIGIRALSKEFQASEAIDGDHSFRFVHGYHAIVEWLSAGLDLPNSLRLNNVVSRIRWVPGRATVSAHSQFGDQEQVYSARRVVCTAPLGVLQTRPGAAGAIHFDPEPQNIEATRRLEMGQAMRIVLRFREPFWEKLPGLQDLGFLHSLDETMPTWWTSMPVRAPIVTGWAAGRKAEQLSGHGEAFVVGRALESLSRLLGVSSNECESLLESWHVHDWQADPYARGAYSYVPVNGIEAIRQLAEPVEDTLYFAGEAIDLEGRWGTVHAAIASGERAARQITESELPPAERR